MHNCLLHGLKLHADAGDGDERDLVEDIALVFKRREQVDLEILCVDVREMNGLQLADSSPALDRFLVAVFEMKTADFL